MNEYNPLSKKEVEKLNDENITIKEQKEILKKIDERLNYIVLKIAEVFGRQIEWFDYDNGYQQINGKFDPRGYGITIYLDGQYNNLIYKGVEIENYNFCIPTEFLYENFEEQIKNEFDEITKKIDILVEKRKEANEKEIKTFFEFLNKIANIKNTQKEYFQQQMKSILESNGYQIFTEKDLNRILDLLDSNNVNVENKKIAKEAIVNIFKYYP